MVELAAEAAAMQSKQFAPGKNVLVFGTCVITTPTRFTGLWNVVTENGTGFCGGVPAHPVSMSAYMPMRQNKRNFIIPPVAKFIIKIGIILLFAALTSPHDFALAGMPGQSSPPPDDMDRTVSVLLV
jgi:hypothetical protein